MIRIMAASDDNSVTAQQPLRSRVGAVTRQRFQALQRCFLRQYVPPAVLTFVVVLPSASRLRETFFGMSALKAQDSFTDPESRIMKRADIIGAAEVVNSSSNAQQLLMCLMPSKLTRIRCLPKFLPMPVSEARRWWPN